MPAAILKFQIPNPKLLHVLYEDNHLLAVDKPAGLPTMGVSADEPSLIAEAKSYIKGRYHKPGNVYLGIVSRLDAPVSGLVVLARTSKAAARLTEQYRSRSVEKVYWAVVEGQIDPAAATLTDWIVKDEKQQRMRVVPAEMRGAVEARLSYRLLKQLPGASLIEVVLETGRKHQIRLQLAERGFPILGDRKYGSRRRFPQGIALHARRLSLEHPVKKSRVELESPLPEAWQAFVPR